MADKKALKVNKRPKDDLSDDEDEQKQEEVEKMKVLSNVDEEEEDEMRYELGYWKIQGLASAARMMLNYADVPYKNKMYTIPDSPDADGNWDYSNWTDVKFKLDLDFPNLPYIMDKKTGFKISQAKSIYRYIASEFKIGVQTYPNLGVADMMLEMIGQIMWSDAPLTRSAPYKMMSYGNFDPKQSDEEHQADKARYIKKMPTLLKEIEDFMANKKFVCGFEISYADFELYYLCVTHATLDTTFGKRFPNLNAFAARFGALEGMKRWHQTPNSKLPFNNIMAKFGNIAQEAPQFQNPQK